MDGGEEPVDFVVECPIGRNTNRSHARRRLLKRAQRYAETVADYLEVVPVGHVEDQRNGQGTLALFYQIAAPRGCDLYPARRIPEHQYGHN